MSTTASTPFKALDACHLQIQQHLGELQRMARHMQDAGLDEADRKLAGEIQAFFSSTSRAHHELEGRQSAASSSLQADLGWRVTRSGVVSVECTDEGSAAPAGC